ncbi:MAG: sensor histidine kinase [Lysobacter sp.]|nr:sensor histidine kinase [Lysobacter sp.]MDQ3206912.1 sensor histidine kinase [Pseudomonadota bacterium]
MVIGLSDFITANNELIVDECEAFARTLGSAAEDMDREALRDHIGQILVTIAADMKQPQSERERAEKSKGQTQADPDGPSPAAETHGALRAASGFDVSQTAAEYRALRASVIRLWLRTSPTLGPTQVEELTRFNEAMDQALAETLLQFATAAAYSRNLFLGVLSHELRTPLGTIVGSAQTLLHVANQHPQLRDASNRILRGGRRIESVLDDLLDFVRSGAEGGLRVNPAEAKMDDLCVRIAREVEAAFPGSSIELTHEGDMTGFWDEQRVAQALSNLMSNAIKYGAPDAPVRVSLDGNASTEVMVSVHNQGAEIDPEKLESLFQPLVRGAGSDPTGCSLGLGLFIVREIATAHGGTVEVTSSDDGTTFSFRLPRSADATQGSAIGRMRRT